MWVHDRLAAKTGVPGVVNYAHEKMNGHRLTFFKQKSGRIIALSRNDIEMDCTEWPWYEPITRLPPLSSVDGELVCGSPSDVRTAINERWKSLKFHTFAVPWYDGTPRTYCNLEWLDGVCSYHGLSVVPWEHYRPSVDYIERAKNDRIEGFVLKTANYHGWWKVKPVKTIDVIVMGYTAGRGKFGGMVGSIKCGVIHKGALVEVASISGMTDNQRMMFCPKKDIGRVLEVAYDRVGKRRLIFPRFLRWRDDMIGACSSQDPALWEVL